jgi:hypothetical protein
MTIIAGHYFLPAPVTAARNGAAWYCVADTLSHENIDLKLPHAKYAKVKTDTVDATTVAQLLRADLIPEAHMTSPELRPLRDALRSGLVLVQKDVSAEPAVRIRIRFKRQ